MLAIIIPAVGISNPLQYSFFFFSTPVFLPGKFQWQKSLAGCSPWGCRVEPNWVTEHTSYFYYCCGATIYVASAGLTEGGTVLRVW